MLDGLCHVKIFERKRYHIDFAITDSGVTSGDTSRATSGATSGGTSGATSGQQVTSGATIQRCWQHHSNIL